MNYETLSQEEIDALLKGEGGNQKAQLTDLELDTLGEISNIFMGTAATTLSSLVGKKVEITTPRIQVTTSSRLQIEHPLPYVAVKVRYTEGLKGTNVLIIKIHDAGVIVDLMMGGDGSNPPEELEEIHLSAISEAMNQMMGSGATSMSEVFRKRVNISPPTVSVLNFAEERLDFNGGNETDDEELVKVLFRMYIENVVDSEVMQITPISFAKQISSQLLAEVSGEPGLTPVAESGAEPDGIADDREDDREKVVRPSENGENGAAEREITVQPVQFAPLEAGQAPQETGNLSLILDVPLEFTVELGRTQRTIKEILELGPGAIVELDKLAGEAVDIFVNGKSIAKGEVVVIDENYGVRITEILSSAERINKLR
ncbi:MAG: flagellar motor switch protein FliN [Thermacetogenium sp.]|nr:flagellar motor switch protein FliN [Thermacetogenium sp.]